MGNGTVPARAHARGDRPASLRHPSPARQVSRAQVTRGLPPGAAAHEDGRAWEGEWGCLRPRAWVLGRTPCLGIGRLSRSRAVTAAEHPCPTPWGAGAARCLPHPLAAQPPGAVTPFLVTVTTAQVGLEPGAVGLRVSGRGLQGPEQPLPLSPRRSLFPRPASPPAPAAGRLQPSPWPPPAFPWSRVWPRVTRWGGLGSGQVEVTWPPPFRVAGGRLLPGSRVPGLSARFPRLSRCHWQDEQSDGCWASGQ